MKLKSYAVLTLALTCGWIAFGQDSLTLVCASVVTAQPNGSGRSQKTLHREISMGTGEWNDSNSCVIVGSRLSADQFFEGLVIQRENESVRFLKDAREVADFPSTLNVQLRFMVTKCNAKGKQDDDAARSVIEKLLFNVEWKDELKVWPVRRFTSRIRKPTVDDLPEGIGVEANRSQHFIAPLWTVDLTVKDEKVPLTTSLVVTILDERKQQVARLSARL